MNLQKILKHQRAFVKARAWDQFHSPKNLSAALSVEASELLEIFQWMDGEESRRPDKKKKGHIEEEVADVFFYLLRICDLLDIDPEKAFWKKMKKNAKKYPVRLAKNSSAKYTEFRRKTKARS